MPGVSGAQSTGYRIDADTIVLLDVFQKTTPKTPQRALDA
jgi:hypothetical protein